MKLQWTLYYELIARLTANVMNEKTRNMAKQIVLLVDHWKRDSEGIDMELVRLSTACIPVTAIRES
jgi:hypothetical protein